MRLVTSLAFIIAVTTSPAHAQDQPATILAHSSTTIWWVSGQINLIGQQHASFPAIYSGEHSFRRTSERALSGVLTLYTGLRLRHEWEILFDVETATGRGLSDAFGLAGFTDLDV